ncbi:MAG TPA: lysine 2,3-aminomutase [Ignavibacteriaceae bacterium]
MITPRKMKFYSVKDIDSIPQMKSLKNDEKFALKVVSNILPFRTNNYVVEELIDWKRIPEDPIYQLTFLHKNMLSDHQFDRVADAINKNLSQVKLKKIINDIRLELNPHPAGQMTENVPMLEDEPLPGVQHKYRETVLIFPSGGQTCHAFCSFCFRWAQFVGIKDLKFATDESMRFQHYLKSNKEVSDVLLTGGDPMIMGIKNIKAYLEPLLKPEFEHIQSIRIGTKSVAYWPFKFVTDKEADELLRLFERIVKAGKHLAIMGHYNHWKELVTDVAREAVKRIRNTGAQIRTQSPLIKHINDDPAVWSRMWNDQVKLGCIPYYFFVERNTGAKNYFEIPLVRAYDIFRNAFKKVSGLGRTVRGPSMSSLPGKIAVEGIAEIKGEKVFVLTLIQARNPEWCKRPFFAKYDPEASWYTELKPAFNKNKFFFQDEMNEILMTKNGQMFFRDDYGNALEESQELVA